MSRLSELVTGRMLWRSAFASLIVGGMLFLLNNDLNAVTGPWTSTMWGRLGLSMAAPFVVSLTSAILTREEFLRGGRN